MAGGTRRIWRWWCCSLWRNDFVGTFWIGALDIDDMLWIMDFEVDTGKNAI